MGFVLYDLAFLALFVLVLILFLVIKRKNLQRQGLLYLYRTSIGIKIIDYTSRKFSKILKPLQYVVIASGYALMGIIIYMLAKFSWFYLTSPVAAKALKVPVLMPLIPYLPELFKITFLPPFYFTYWIIIIAIIAVPHEFAHGIFARLNKIKVHSTGFGFLGPFLAAFVEPDEKQMAKLKKIPQLSILASGTFANILTAVFFALIMWLFFALSFAPAGVNFNSYSTSIVNVSEITSISNQTFDGTTFVEINTGNASYFANPDLLNQAISQGISQIIVYDNSPAFNSRLSGAISEIDEIKITSEQQLSSAIKSHLPGDKITIKTINTENPSEITSYNITLADNGSGKAFLGIGFIPLQSSGITGKFYSFITNIKNPLIYYESAIGNIGIFIYDLLWWLVLISLSVALVNMIPVGIFDGGRFFYLTILALTKSEKVAQKAFKASTLLVLVLVALLMVKWILAIF